MKSRKPAKPQREVRVYAGRKVELRQSSDGSPATIVGYGAVFPPALSQDLGGWAEEVDPHAFDECLASGVDCRALWNHNDDHILGRTKSGTLKLSVDSVGLRYEITPPDTQIARDLITSIKRQDIDQSSFGFICKEDDWRVENNQVIRRVLKANVFDVSPVTYPAYPDATSGIRASLRSCPADIRSRITRNDDDLDEDDEDDYRPECDEDSGDFDPEADCPDDDESEADNKRSDSLRIRTLFDRLMSAY